MPAAATVSSRILLIDPASRRLYPSAPAGTVHLASAPCGWRGLLAELHRIPPTEMDRHELVGHRLVVNTGRHATPFGWRLDGGTVQETLFRPGEFALQTHGDTNAPRWSSPFEFMAFALEPGFVAEVAGLPLAAVEFQPRRGEDDPVLASFAEAFRRELAGGNVHGALYAEALAISFTLHLLAQHGVRRPRSMPAGRGKLSAFQVRRVVDYVQAHVSEPFGLADLARQANLSLFHFARLFHATLGISPHHFVLRLRVDKARSLLTSHDRRDRQTLAQVALAAGFYDQAHLTRVFRHFFGTTPGYLVRRDLAR